jgi:hypothetical protein
MLITGDFIGIIRSTQEPSVTLGLVCLFYCFVRCVALRVSTTAFVCCCMASSYCACASFWLNSCMRNSQYFLRNGSLSCRRVHNCNGGIAHVGQHRVLERLYL